MESSVEPEELRIGNLVNFRDKTVEVQALSKLHIKIWCEEKLRIRWVAMRDVQAIELSEEWMPRLGFDNGAINGHWCPKETVSVRFDDYIEVYYIGEYIRRAKHLHEFQNMYFCLMGEELKINCPIV